MILHELKLTCTKYEVKRCQTHVEVILAIVWVAFVWGSPLQWILCCFLQVHIRQCQDSGIFLFSCRSIYCSAKTVDFCCCFLQVHFTIVPRQWDCSCFLHVHYTIVPRQWNCSCFLQVHYTIVPILVSSRSILLQCQDSGIFLVSSRSILLQCQDSGFVLVFCRFIILQCQNWVFLLFSVGSVYY